MAVVLINEDTQGTVATLEGIERGSHSFPGVVTDHPLSDGSQRADARKIRPRTLSLIGTAAAFAQREGEPTGDARVDAVIGRLRELQVNATPLTVVFPDREPLVNMLLESFGEEFSGQISSPIALELKEVRTASRRAILLQPAGAAPGPPRADIAPGQAETEERGATGPKPLQSTAAAGLDFGASLLGLGG